MDNRGFPNSWGGEVGQFFGNGCSTFFFGLFLLFLLGAVVGC